MNREETAGSIGAVAIIVAAIFIIIVVSVCSNITSTYLDVGLQDVRTEANQNSQGYVEAQQNLLLQLVGEYNELQVSIAEATSDVARNAYTAQANGLIDRMTRIAATIDAEQVPQSVRDVIGQ